MPRLVLCMLREISYYNSTYGLRPSHYTPLRVETGLTPTVIPITNRFESLKRLIKRVINFPCPILAASLVKVLVNVEL